MAKQICFFQECQAKIKPVDVIMGKCRCENIYCIKHRMPETHQCCYIFKMDKHVFITSNKCVTEKMADSLTSDSS